MNFRYDHITFYENSSLVEGPYCGDNKPWFTTSEMRKTYPYRPKSVGNSATIYFRSNADVIETIPNCNSSQSNMWSCCSPSNQCGMGDGDCDSGFTL